MVATRYNKHCAKKCYVHKATKSSGKLAIHGLKISELTTTFTFFLQQLMLINV